MVDSKVSTKLLMMFVIIRTWRKVKSGFYVTKRITTFLIMFINITIKKRSHIQYITVSLYVNIIYSFYSKLKNDF